jgi:hypothetical protein
MPILPAASRTAAFFGELEPLPTGPVLAAEVANTGVPAGSGHYMSW